MDRRERAARFALLASEVKRTGTCARTGVPLSINEAVLVVLPTPLLPSPPRPTTTVLLARAEWNRISERALMVAAAKGQAVRVIDGREFHKEIEMRRKRLKLAVVEGKTYVEVNSLLVAMRERGHRTVANEVEIAVLRQKAGQGIQPVTNGRVTLPAPGDLDLAVAA